MLGPDFNATKCTDPCVAVDIANNYTLFMGGELKPCTGELLGCEVPTVSFLGGQVRAG